MKSLVSLLLFALGLQAQVAHPRIWLDSTTKTRLLGLVSANDPSWVAFKAKSDAFVTKTVLPWQSGSCNTTTQICWDYDGGGWLDASEYLGLAYQMTGDTTYSNQLKLVLTAMVNAGVTGIATPTTGYSSRNVALALGLSYDWIYDQLSPTDKTNLCALLDIYYNFIQTGGSVVNWGVNMSPYGNFTTGHILGLGVAALATEGDDANYAAMMGVIQTTAWNNYVVQGFTGPAHRVSTSFATGGYEGGYPEESWNYGGNGLIRLMQYASAYETAGKGDLGYRTYSVGMVKNAIYNLQPDWWSTTMEGAYPGARHIQYHNYPYILSNLLRGQTAGGWAKYMEAHMVANPAGITAYNLTPFEAFMYNNADVTAVDYTATQIPAFYSAGDNHTYARSDWTSSAVEATFAGTAAWYTGHQAKNAGHIAIQRGGDFLLIHEGQWSTNASPAQYGISGTPSTDNENDSWPLNELFYYDGGTAAGGYCLDPTSGVYAGCKGAWGAWGLPNAVSHKETAEYTYQKADLRPAFFDNYYLGGRTTITSYNRSFLFLGGITFVYDRLVSSASTRTVKQFWHFNSAATNSIVGNVAKSSVGTSNLFIASVLPASPTIALVDDNTTWTGSTKITTRAEISDPANPATTQLLTVLAPTASSVGAMPATTLLTASGFVGAIYTDAAPRVALFSADGTPQASVTYTVSYDPQLTGRHVVLDLTPGFYTVWKDGVMLYHGILVGKDGSLSFVSNGGGAYTVGQAALPTAAFQGRGGIGGMAVLR